MLNLSWNLSRVAAICDAANFTEDEYYFTPDDDSDYHTYGHITAAMEEEYNMTPGRDATRQQVPTLAAEQAKELASEEARKEGTLVTITGEEAHKEDTPVTVTGEVASEEDDGHS